MKIGDKVELQHIPDGFAYWEGDRGIIIDIDEREGEYLIDLGFNYRLWFNYRNLERLEK